MGSFYVPESAMAIVAHPDDIEFSCAGTLARWAAAGASLSYVICTSGEVGITEPGLTRTEAGRIREAEQRRAAEIVGAAEVIFLREPDGMLEATLELRKKLVREIRRFRPEVVVCGDPTVMWVGSEYINHPDHRAAATAALDAAFPAAGQPKLFADLEDKRLTAHKPRKVYVFEWGQGDLFVNIEETLHVKLAALRAHASQIRELEDFDAEKAVRKWATELGVGKEMDYAESFRVITLESDEAWQKKKGHVATAK